MGSLSFYSGFIRDIVGIGFYSLIRPLLQGEVIAVSEFTGLRSTRQNFLKR